MPSLFRNLALLLFFLNASPHFHSQLFGHAASTSPPVTRPRIIFLTALEPENDEDDDEDYPDNHSSPPEVLSSMRTTLLQQPLQLCQYNPCVENQEPCAQVSAKTRCLCPGISGADMPPHAPRIHMLRPVIQGENRGKVEVQWCAPSSVVSQYRVVIEGGEDALEFQAVSRRGLVRSLEAGTKVCVEALNKAGSSSPSEFSCQRYDPPDTSDHKMLAGVIGGGVALLVLLVIAAVISWKFQICQKAKRDSSDGLGNPSYSTEGTL